MTLQNIDIKWLIKDVSMLFMFDVSPESFNTEVRYLRGVKGIRGRERANTAGTITPEITEGFRIPK